jgi:hypothetical protein
MKLNALRSTSILLRGNRGRGLRSAKGGVVLLASFRTNITCHSVPVFYMTTLELRPEIGNSGGLVLAQQQWVLLFARISTIVKSNDVQQF